MPLGYTAVFLPQIDNTTDPLWMDREMASWFGMSDNANIIDHHKLLFLCMFLFLIMSNKNSERP